MSWPTDDNFVGWGDDRQSPGHYTSTSLDSLATGSSFSSEIRHTGGPRLESYLPTGLASTTSSCPSIAIPDGPFAAGLYGGSVWQGNQRRDGTHLGPLPGNPGGNADAMGTFTEMDIAAPVSQQALPTFQRALPTSLPLLNWAQPPGPPWQSAPSWDHPVCSVTPPAGQSRSIGSLGMNLEVPCFPLPASSTTTGHSDRRVMLTGHLPSMSAPHSTRPFIQSGPLSVSAITSRPRGERWDPSTSASTFQCIWASGETRCTAVIAGDRRSVTSHLRDEHDFVCDGQTVPCAWGSCTARMQRRNIPRHIVACHFEVKVTCEQCGMALSRADANKKHRSACTGGGGGARAPAVVGRGEQTMGGSFGGVGAPPRF